MTALRSRGLQLAFALLLGAMLVGAATTPAHANGGPHPYGRAYAAPGGRVAYVSIYNFAFHPASLRVQRGTIVVWTNRDPMPHTVTFNNGMADSGIIYPGQSVWFTFTRVGSFGYHCRIHPFMHGRVVVGA